jgi:sodium-dependent phosphate cotransporter
VAADERRRVKSIKTEEQSATPVNTDAQETSRTVTLTVANKVAALANILFIIALIYLFLLAVEVLGCSFKLFGSGFAQGLIRATGNPVVGLCIGMLATVLVDSSSMTTSTIVALVASGTLSLRSAIPMVMGANIGTTVGSMWVVAGYTRRKVEFRRAVAVSSVHDFFNILTASILLPVECATHFLERIGGWLGSELNVVGEFTFKSPLDTVIEPPARLIKHLFTGALGFSDTVSAIFLIVCGLGLLFTALFLLVRSLKHAIITRVSILFDRVIGKGGVIGIFFGTFVTAIIQSSSVLTSLLVPVGASGIATLRQVYSITLGANMGTTVTAILASLTGNAAGMAIAICHLLFNVTGVCIFYPARAVPMSLAEGLASLADRRKLYLVLYVLITFFAIPGLVLAIHYLW